MAVYGRQIRPVLYAHEAQASPQSLTTDYTYGINFRALAAYCVGAGVNFAGCTCRAAFPNFHSCAVLNNMGVKGFGTGVIRSFYFAFITTGTAAGLTYYLLARLFPQKTYIDNKHLSFFEWTPEEVEVYAAGNNWREKVDPISAAPETPLEDEMGKKEATTTVNVLEA